MQANPAIVSVGHPAGTVKTFPYRVDPEPLLNACDEAD
jgi:hypothetical protein